MNENIYSGFIYKITNSINEKIYIGQTYASIPMRWHQHKSSSRMDRYKHLPLYRAMNKYGIDKFEISCIKEINCFSKDKLKDKLNKEEIYYISQYNSISPNGYNLTIGGNNAAEHIKTAVCGYDANGNLCLTFNSISEAGVYLDNPSYTHISACCKGEVQQACGYIWRYLGDDFDKYPVAITQEELDKKSCEIPVDQYTLDGIFIQSYESIRKALISIGKIDGGSPISLCCKGLQNKAYGYVWRYKGHSFNEYEQTHKDWTPIDVYNINGELIGTFTSIMDGVRQLGVERTSSSIIKCLCGISNQCGGYVWRYHGDAFNKFGDPTHRKKKQTKIINMYSLDGVFLQTIKSVNSYAKQNGLAGGSNILEAVKFKENHVAYGFKWFYADDPNQPDMTKIISKGNEGLVGMASSF